VKQVCLETLPRLLNPATAILVLPTHSATNLAPELVARVEVVRSPTAVQRNAIA